MSHRGWSAWVWMWDIQKRACHNSKLYQTWHRERVCAAYQCLMKRYDGHLASFTKARDPGVMSYCTNECCAPSPSPWTAITRLPLQVRTDIWLIHCEALPPLQIQGQTPVLWLIKNQTELSLSFSFASLLANREAARNKTSPLMSH